MLSPADFPIIFPWLGEASEDTRSSRHNMVTKPECVARWEDDGGAIAAPAKHHDNTPRPIMTIKDWNGTGRKTIPAIWYT